MRIQQALARLLRRWMLPPLEISAGTIASLRLEPDDLVILRFPDCLSIEQVRHIQEAWKRLFEHKGALPPPVIVLERGASLEVARGGWRKPETQ